MPCEYLQSAQSWLPAGAAGASVTTNSASWGNSAWAEIIASTPSAYLLTAIVVTPPTAGSGTFEIDIGVGAIGAETVIATHRGYFSTLTSNQAGMCWLPLSVAIDAIAAGARVVVRIRRAGTGTMTWRVAIGVIAKPATGTLLTTAQPSKAMPAASASISITPNGTAWANSAFAEVVASTAAAIVLLGAVIVAGVEASFELDIAVGGAGAEQVVTTFSGYDGFAIYRGGPFFYPLPLPLDNIGAAARIAARLRKSGTSTATWALALVYMEKPL